MEWQSGEARGTKLNPSRRGRAEAGQAGEAQEWAARGPSPAPSSIPVIKFKVTSAVAASPAANIT